MLFHIRHALHYAYARPVFLEPTTLRPTPFNWIVTDPEALRLPVSYPASEAHALAPCLQVHACRSQGLAVNGSKRPGELGRPAQGCGAMDDDQSARAGCPPSPPESRS